MRKYPDHPFIAQKRRELRISEDADFLPAFVEKRFVQGNPAQREKDLAAFDEYHKTNPRADLRSESQFDEARWRLRQIDELMRNAKR